MQSLICSPNEILSAKSFWFLIQKILTWKIKFWLVLTHLQIKSFFGVFFFYFCRKNTKVLHLSQTTNFFCSKSVVMLFDKHWLLSVEITAEKFVVWLKCKPLVFLRHMWKDGLQYNTNKDVLTLWTEISFKILKLKFFRNYFFFSFLTNEFWTIWFPLKKTCESFWSFWLSDLIVQ